MARIKRAVAAKKKRRTVMHRAKGYYGAASRTYKHAKEQVQHSLQYQYRDRRNKKREIRSLWITRINAAARLNDISYSQFIADRFRSIHMVLFDRKRNFSGPPLGGLAKNKSKLDHFKWFDVCPDATLK